MEKIVVYNIDKEVSFTIEGVVSATPSLDSITYLVENEGAGKLTGIDGGYIILSEDADETTLDYQEVIEYNKQLKIEQLSKECNEAITQGFEYNGDYFPYSLEDQQNMSQQLAMCSVVAPITPIEIRTINNGTKEVDMYEFIRICQAGDKHRLSKVNIFRQAKEQILTTQYETVQELKTVYISFNG
jgi:hypothetical protein